MIYVDSDGKELELVIDSLGTKRYFNSKDLCHRLDGPALEWPNGSYAWYKDGKYHRVGGPEYYWVPDYYYEWYINGKYVNVYYICG